MKPGRTMEDVLIQDIEEDNFSLSFTPNLKYNEVECMIIHEKDCCTAYTDRTRRLPQKSSQGN